MYTFFDVVLLIQMLAIHAVKCNTVTAKLFNIASLMLNICL